MKPMRNFKLIVWELIVDGGRWWRATSPALRITTLGLALACGFPVAAQEPDGSVQTNDMTAAEVLSHLNSLVQADDSTQPEDMAPSNDLSATNAVPQASAPTPGEDRPNRFIHPDNSTAPQNDDRRSRGRRALRSRSDQPGGYGSASGYSSRSDRNQANSAGGTSNGPVSLDYAAFKVIVDKNIFDPNRVPHGPGVPTIRRPPKSFDSLTLVGTMS
jgi:hypothetical protein